MKHVKARRGFTLVELTFSIAFLTVLAFGSTITFVYILGVYNKAQSLTRTQAAARQSMDALVRDLRLTDAVIPRSLVGFKNAYCLSKSDGSTTLYALRLSSTGKYQLVRYSIGCNASIPVAIAATQPYEQLVAGDLWSDDGTLPVEYAALVIQPADSRCPTVNTAGCPTTVPIWLVRTSVFRGASVAGKIPGTASADVKDTFGAGTTLQSTVSTRD